MSNFQKALLFGFGVIGALVLAGALKMHVAAQKSTDASRTTGLAQMSTYLSAPGTSFQKLLPANAVNGVAGGVAGGISADKQIIRTASLTLVVQDVSAALAQLRKLTLELHGEIDESRVWSLSEHTREGAISVRVPSAQLDAALKQFESTARRVTNEQFDSTDVTRQYTDDAARMRSLQAEEQQYLQILKQAKSVQDVLDVTEKLSDVRTSVEELQTEINAMQHNVAMSAVAISVTQNGVEATGLAAWHPLLNAKAVARSMVESLGDWVDSVVAIIIYLPVISLWLVTVGAIVWGGWKPLSSMWRRRKPASPVPPRSDPSFSPHG